MSAIPSETTDVAAPAPAANDGWYLHSQGRRFGPLGEDDMRGYFRAGMVDANDSIAVAGEHGTVSAAQAAALLEVVPPRAKEMPRTLALMPLPQPLPPSIFVSEVSTGRVGMLGALLALVVMVGLLYFGLRQNFAPAAVVATPAPADVQREAEKRRDTRFEEAKRLVDAGDWAGLQSHAQQWSHDDPGNDRAMWYLGKAHERLEQYPQAIAAFQQTLRITPDHLNAQIELAWIDSKTGRYQESADMLGQLVSEGRADAYVWNILGYDLAKLGRPGESLTAIEKSIALDPDQREAWEHLSYTYELMGNTVRAQEAKARALTLKP